MGNKHGSQKKASVVKGQSHKYGKLARPAAPIPSTDQINGIINTTNGDDTEQQDTQHLDTAAHARKPAMLTANATRRRSTITEMSESLLTLDKSTFVDIMSQSLINIGVSTTEFAGSRFNDCFFVTCMYSQEETLQNVFEEIVHRLEETFYPKKFELCSISHDSFTGKVTPFELETMAAQPITKYDKQHILDAGLKVVVCVKYAHQIAVDEITCKYMKVRNTENPLQCPMYCAMKSRYEFTEENLAHLNEFTHFRDEVASKPLCKFGDGCYKYIRLEQSMENRLSDLCHMKLYRHPPRKRHIKLQENIHSLVYNEESKENHPFYEPSEIDNTRYQFNKYNGYLSALIHEVMRNGYRSDLCVQCKQSASCTHTDFSILKIVDAKMQHIRHLSMDRPLRRDHMLALVLYTGCDCNYDLCATQRNGKYLKWKWFDYCLYWAIIRLSRRETGSFAVFSGLSGVQLNRRVVENGYFKTFVSTSWQKPVAMEFMGANNSKHGHDHKQQGMIIQIDSQYKDDALTPCCDCSWISKFPDECEILFARSSQTGVANFECVVLEETTGIQTVALRKNYKKEQNRKKKKIPPEESHAAVK